MKKRTLLFIPLALCLFSAVAVAQRPTYPAAPLTMSSGAHADLAQLQKEADDLARTTQSIPPGLESVRRGMLPKDGIQKLQQIEKLSKRLRSEPTL